MAKKRKAATQSQEPANGPESDPRESRKRIRTFEDVAGSDDEFHLNQDEIRLGEDPAVKRRRRIAEDEEFLEPSDEEVLGYSEQEEEEEQEVDGDAASEASEGQRKDGDDDDDEAELGWGMSKADLYGADDIETEEQALEEEAEALRLQKKQLAHMQAADYGVDEDDEDWQLAGAKQADEENKTQSVVTEVLPQLQIDRDMSSAERLKVLKSQYPEFDPLSKELLRLQEVHTTLASAATPSPVIRTKLRAASAYLGALVMYFSLFASTASQSGNEAIAMPANKLRDHPVMDSLVQCRELWTNVQSLPETQAESVQDFEIDLSGDQESDIEDLAQASLEKSAKKSRAERHADAIREASDKRKAERLRQTEADLADLDTLIAPASKTSTKASRQAKIRNDDSDIGEEVPLTAREAADKANRKKSLRFYTSQIAQKANKRGTAGRNAGGDDDIPYRERLKDRQARLNAEAEKRGKRRDDIGDDLGGESDEDDARQAQQIRTGADEDDYYDLVAARASKKKSDKAAFADAQRQAVLEGGRVVQEETVGTDGKRKITYAIEKNKGLTPHRKKDVRNPRVKKRKKYDEKKKKLASIKPVYKGGEGRGGYGGELTGIKKGLVKSTKLS